MPVDYDAGNHKMDRSFLAASIPELVAQLTLDEKRELITSQGWWHASPVPRLNIPSVKVTDGPGGARGGNAYNMTPGVAFPAATCVGATFDPELAEEMGRTLAEETKARGAVCLLGPTINIQRSPLGGRAFESFSEDPTLSGRLAAAYCRGLEARGVSATLKHFVGNDQENDRSGSDAVIAPRALREVYLRPFQLALAGAPASAVMAGYNKVNGTHASEHPALLQDLLRREWGFGGLVMSDWFGTYSVAEAINAGLNIEFPGPSRWRTKVLFDQTYETHKTTRRHVDHNAAHVLRWVQKLARRNEALVYGADRRERTRAADQAADAALVRRIATEGITLLKNADAVLPVRAGRVAVIGPNAKAKVFTGGGSARLQSAWGATPWQAMVDRNPGGVELTYALGTSTTRYAPLLDDCFAAHNGTVGFDMYHYPVLPDGSQAPQWLAHDHLYRSEVRFNDFFVPGLERGKFSELKAVFTAPISGEYEFGISITGKGWFWVDDVLVWSLTDYRVKGSAFYGAGTAEQFVRIKVAEGKKYNIRLLHDFREPPNVEYTVPATFRYGGIRLGAQPAFDPESSIKEAADAARAADVAVVVCGLGPDWESEGDDRPDLALPLATDELIAAVSAANPNTVVVLQGGSAVAMPWLSAVKGVLAVWYGGNETGTAIADVVYGRANPCGRLPLTYPAAEADPSAALSFRSERGKVYYDDGIYVGYKHYNARRIPPLFPFGHGLSYTSFAYSALCIDTVSPPGTPAAEWRLAASLTVTNTGPVSGSHSVHLYASPPPRTRQLQRAHPSHTLQAFAKAHALAPGASVRLAVALDKYAISHWDEADACWAAEHGTWRLSIGRDAQTLAEHVEFHVAPGFQWVGL